MKNRTLIMLLISFALFTSCTENEKNYTVREVNGIKTFSNKNKSSVENLTITPKELFTITSSDSSIADSTRTIFSFTKYDVDSKGNIFILDRTKSSVKKFDAKGTYVKSFGNKGKGPGESEMSWNMTILNDTILYDDYFAKQMVKFDNDGNYIDNIVLPAGEFERFMSISKSNIVGYQAVWEEKGSDAFLGYHLTIVDSKFRKIKQLTTHTIKFVQEKYNFFDAFLDPYAHSETELFVAEKSTDKYKINAYTFSGELLYSITKNYARMQFSDEEWEIFNELYKNWEVNKNNKSRNKTAINEIEYDKYGRLWVFASVKRDNSNLTDLLIDVFKDGVFLNQIKLDICSGNDFVDFFKEIRLINDKLYLFDSKEQTLTVYDY